MLARGDWPLGGMARMAPHHPISRYIDIIRVYERRDSQAVLIHSAHALKPRKVKK